MNKSNVFPGTVLAFPHVDILTCLSFFPGLRQRIVIFRLVHLLPAHKTDNVLFRSVEIHYLLEFEITVEIRAPWFSAMIGEICRKLSMLMFIVLEMAFVLQSLTFPIAFRTKQSRNYHSHERPNFWFRLWRQKNLDVCDCSRLLLWFLGEIVGLRKKGHTQY